jgi:hypothetical protein
MAEEDAGPSSIPFQALPSQLAIGGDERYPNCVALKVSTPTGYTVVFVPFDYGFSFAQRLGAYCHAKLTSTAPKLIVPNGKSAHAHRN